MARFERVRRFVLRIVRDIGCRMEEVVDAVPTICSVDGASVFSSDLFDDITEVAIQCAGFCYRYRCVQCFSGSSDESSASMSRDNVSLVQDGAMHHLR